MTLVSSRLSALGIVQTTVEGRVEAAHIREMVDGYRTHDKGRGLWLILAEKATSYGPDAIREAVSLFGDLHRERGLKKIYTVLLVPTVRMGASVVSMGLRAAGFSLEILIFKTQEEAAQSIKKESATSG